MAWDMMGSYSFGFSLLWGIIALAFVLGLTFLVWILVIKFWKEIKSKK